MKKSNKREYISKICSFLISFVLLFTFLHLFNKVIDLKTYNKTYSDNLDKFIIKIDKKDESLDLVYVNEVYEENSYQGVETIHFTLISNLSFHKQNSYSVDRNFLDKQVKLHQIKGNKMKVKVKYKGIDDIGAIQEKLDIYVPKDEYDSFIHSISVKYKSYVKEN